MSLPPARLHPEYRQAGREWDVVRMRAPLGLRVLDQLGEETGRVARDEEGRLLWFVPVGQAPDVGAQAEILSLGVWVSLPAPDREHGDGPRWLRPYDDGLCAPDRLAAALAAALGHDAGGAS